MATLILQQNGIRCGGILNGALYIGRRPANSLVILDPSVSRLHAWIGRADERYFIADAASRTGTFVNQERITGRRPLKDGDCIRIGPAEMVFHEGNCLPSMIQTLQFTPSRNTDAGIFFECACGQLMWADSKLAGRSAQCASCGVRLRIPDRPAGHPSKGAVADSNNPPPSSEPRPSDTENHQNATGLCSICQSPITEDETMQTCPDCGASFHQQCWEENRGCASYGCSQAHVLDKSGLESDPGGLLQDRQAARPMQDQSQAAAGRALPWEHLLLAGSALSIPVGVLLFGVPGLLMVILSVVGMKRASRRGVVILALVLAIAAVILGVVVSWFWWFAKAT